MAATTLEDIKRDHTEFMRQAHILLAEDLILDMSATANTGIGYGSPVLSGQFAGSIRAAFGESSDVLMLSSDKGFAGAKYPSMAREINNADIDTLMAPLKGFQLGEIIAVGNTLAYGEMLEAGSSKKAPNGILRPTFNRFVDMVAGRMATIRAMLNAEGFG